MSVARAIAALTLRESLRRRVFLVVALLTAGFLALYGLGTWHAFRTTDSLGPTGEAGVDAEIVVGATLLGLSMFATLFLGAILAVFLTLGAVRGDAERGLLQPVLVRPVSRRTLLLARFAAAAAVCAAYTVAVFLAAAVITWAFGGWWPDRVVRPSLQMGMAVAIIAALSLAGSVVLSSTANGIAVLMVFGAGLLAGLLGSIGDALESSALQDVANTASWLLPFEGLYRDALRMLVADVGGVTGAIVQLGPLGGSHDAGPLLLPFAAAYVAGVGALAAIAFARRDL